MLGAVEIGLSVAAVSLSICGVIPALRSYRSLFWGGGILLLTAVLFPRHGNRIGEYLSRIRRTAGTCPRSFSASPGGSWGHGSSKTSWLSS